MLHFIKEAKGEGGENDFADSFRIAEQLRVEKPEAFEFLTTAPIEYIEEGWDFVPFDNLTRHTVLE